MTDIVPEIWLFQPEGVPRTISRALKSLCTDRGWTFEQRNTLRRSLPDHRSRKVRAHLLHYQHATELYIRMHSRNIGVVQVDKTHVPVTPNPKTSLRYFLPLQQFVRYKALHRRIDLGAFADQEAERVAIGLEDWIAQSNKCEGEKDPRCLPFHVFLANLNRYDLDVPDGRRRFNEDHGSQGSRRDNNGLHWDRPSARDMHGRRSLHVAGCRLVQGFHWDVSISSRTTGATELSNTAEVWKVWGDGYVNIYPDAQIRAGRQCARIFPSTRVNR